MSGLHTQPGELQQLLLGHLRTYPHLDFSVQELANVLRRSTGAIANACLRLEAKGLISRAQDKPRRYQLRDATTPR